MERLFGHDDWLANRWDDTATSKGVTWRAPTSQSLDCRAVSSKRSPAGKRSRGEECLLGLAGEAGEACEGRLSHCVKVDKFVINTILFVWLT